jgi:transcriptional regulator with XRE-family HTH domain
MTNEQQEILGLEQFAQTLRTLREGSGLSQADLAALTGVPEHTIYRLEHCGIKKPTLFEVVRLGAYFGLTPEDIAALFGAWELQEPQPTNYTVKLDTALSLLNAFISASTQEAQDELADSLEVITGIMQRRYSLPPTAQSKTIHRLSNEALDKLPPFIKRRLSNR